MKLTENEQILYDFFISVGQVNQSIDYPLVLLSVWADGKKDNTMYAQKDEVIKAYANCLLIHRKDSLDKQLYEAIKKIKGWK